MNALSDITSKSHWLIFIRSFCFLFITTDTAAFLLYFGVGFLLIGKVIDFSPVFITDGYHGGSLQEITEHPFTFLLTISCIFSLLGAFWLTAVAPKYGRFHSLQILIVPWIALIITSPVWGLIWSLYNWPPQSFSDTSVMKLYYLTDAIFGFRMGWLSAIISFPINILSYVTVCMLLFINKKLFIHKSASH
jgi:hypothetical protein